MGLLPVGGCSKGSGEPARGADKSVPVNVAKAETRTVPVELHCFGSVEAYSTVIVKSQVGGLITKVHFAEGDDVKKGDLLLNGSSTGGTQ